MSAPGGRGARRPVAVVFDVNETLFALDHVGDAFESIGLPGSALDLWFARTLSDGFALAATADFATFSDLALYHLDRITRSFGLEHDEATLEHVLDAFQELDVYQDVAPALQRLNEAGTRVATLTNGSADITRVLLRRHRLEALVERCFAAAEAGAWKPRAEPYRFAAQELRLAPADCAMVAVHSWDVHGAKRAGLTAAWVSRLEGRHVPQMHDADVTARRLDEAIDGLLALPPAA